MQILSISIDLNKIDKGKIIEGKKGRYYNLDVIVKDEKDQYGKDVQVVEPHTKEQRQAKTPRVFLGQGKKVWESAPQQKPQTNEEEFRVEDTDDGSGSLPF